MLDSVADGNHSITYLQQDHQPQPHSSLLRTPPTWRSAPSVVAHTVRITHIPELGQQNITQRETSSQEQEKEQLQTLQLPSDQYYQLDSVYYDAADMAPLSPFSQAAINRLRAYKPPPFPLWDRLPTRMRAAVLILLYADRFGDLRVVITMRAASLRNFSGHAALPGGKADSMQETPYQIARREAFEEIGLPADDSKMPKPFRVEKLCQLPPFLARTHVVVMPCVAMLHADPPKTPADTDAELPPPPIVVVEHTLVPRPDADEVAAVFSASLYNFLKSADLPPPPGTKPLPPGLWYEGAWLHWKDVPWRVHNFYVPVNNQRVARPRRPSRRGSGDGDEGGGAPPQDDLDFEGRFRVWGMTGRVMVDAARIAYDEAPEMEHNSSFGDGDVIVIAEKEGSFQESAKGSRM